MKFVFTPVIVKVLLVPALIVGGLMAEITDSVEGSKALNPPRMIKIAISPRVTVSVGQYVVAVQPEVMLSSFIR
jgi:hypothetical protein